MKWIFVFAIAAAFFAMAATTSDAEDSSEAEPEVPAEDSEAATPDGAASAEPEATPESGTVTEAEASTEANIDTTTTSAPSTTTTTTTTTTASPYASVVEMVTPLPGYEFEPLYTSIGGGMLFNISNIYNVLVNITDVKTLEDTVKSALPLKPKIDDDAYFTRQIVYKYIHVKNPYQAAHVFCHRENFYLFGPTNYQTYLKMAVFEPTTIWVNITKIFPAGISPAYTYLDGSRVPEVIYNRPTNFSQGFLFDDSLANNQACTIFDFSSHTFRSEPCDNRHTFFCYGKSLYGEHLRLYKESHDHADTALADSRRLAKDGASLIVRVNSTLFKLPGMRCHTHEPRKIFSLPPLQGVTLPTLLSQLLFRNHKARNIINYLNDLFDKADREDVKKLALSSRSELCLSRAQEPYEDSEIVILTLVGVVISFFGMLFTIYAVVRRYCPHYLGHRHPETASIALSAAPSMGSRSILRQSPLSRRLARSVSFTEGLAVAPSAPPAYNPEFRPSERDRFLETKLYGRDSSSYSSSSSLSSQ